MVTTHKILIVDDTPAGLEVLEDLLAPQGYQLFLAENGYAALETAVSQKPDLILLDVMMPGMDGFEVCRRLRQNPATAEIPIIMVTALNDQQSRLKGIEAGADDFLTKPFDRHELRTRVKMITRLNRYRRLVAERQKFEHVVNHAATGYIILDENEQIIFINHEAQRTLGQRFDAMDILPERPFRELMADSYRLEPASLWQTFPHPLPEEQSRYLIRPETETFRGQWLQVNALPYDDGKGQNTLLTIINVTHQMEEVRDMRNFHRMITHKLRTPLIGLVSGLDVIGKWSKDLTPEQFAELMEIAHVSVERLQSQIEDILHYTRLPVLSQKSTRFSLAELPRLIGRIAMDVEVDTISLTGPDDMGDHEITPSAEMMELVLYELFENARKFHPQNMPEIDVHVSRQGRMIRIGVTDNGRSLVPEQLEQVWIPYYQAEKSFTGEIPGMGLGLPVVASLVWQVNGQCRLYNRPDQPGVTAELILPIAPRYTAAQPAQSAGEPVKMDAPTSQMVTTRIL